MPGSIWRCHWGSTGETVNIEATNGTLLDTENSSLDFTVGKNQVSDLPLNGRNPYGLAALSPGIIPGNNFGAWGQHGSRSRCGGGDQQLSI